MMGTMRSIQGPLLTVATLLATPAALLAHEAPAGEHAWLGGNHAWLAGAAEPLLSPDHFLAGALVAVVVTLGVMRVAKVARRGADSTGARD